MSRSRRKVVKRRRGECYLNWQFWELESPAFVALSADATRVYLFMRKRLSFDASNNGHVPFSHRDAAAVLHAGWRRGSNALAELVHFGFTKCRENGEPGANVRLASEWQLTAFPCGGQEASKNFMRHDGTPFEPPYQRTPKKQTPIFTVKTPRRHSEDVRSWVDGQIDAEPCPGAWVDVLEVDLPARPHPRSPGRARAGRSVQPAVQIQPLEARDLGRDVLGPGRRTSISSRRSEAAGDRWVGLDPGTPIAPVGLRLDLEQHGQEGRVCDLAGGHPPGIRVDVPADRAPADARRRDDQGDRLGPLALAS